MPVVASRCVFCDMAVVTSPTHLCLRRGILIPDEIGSPPTFGPVAPDHETAWRLDHLGGDHPQQGAGR